MKSVGVKKTKGQLKMKMGKENRTGTCKICCYRPFSSLTITMVNIISNILVGKTNNIIIA